jgi:hypothetical protein
MTMEGQPREEGHGRVLQLDFDAYRMDITSQCQLAKADGSATIPCRDKTQETAKVAAFVDQLVLDLEVTFAQRLTVRPVQGNLVLSGFSASCNIGGVGRFDYLETTFSNKDFVLFYSVSDEGCGCSSGGGSSTLAYAAPCQVDQIGRPIVGITNLCKCQLENVNPTTDYNMWFYTFVHEVTHALAFSPQLFDEYLVQDASCPASSNLPSGWCKYGYTANYMNVIKSVSNVRGQTVNYMVSPKVRAWVRDHYGCNTMLGMELENEGGSGTAGSHWETRLAHNELMTGAIKARPSLSGLTLALFEDSGWYKAEASFADAFLWGKGAGCAFVNDRCVQTSGGSSSVVTGGEAEFCTQAQTTPSLCSHDHRALSYCAASTYTSSLPSTFQYFDDPKKGGGIPLYDYCPVISEFSNGLCSNSANKFGYQYGQIFDTGSICLPSTVVTDASGYSATSVNGRCYKRECATNAESGALELRVYFTDSSDYTPLAKYAACPYEGGTIDPSTFVPELRSSTQIICPPYEEVCFGQCPFQCNDNGNCIDEVCQCYPEFTGQYCQTNVCPGACYGNGNCDLLSGMCACNDGYYGIDCSQKECASDEECGLGGNCPLDVHPSVCECTTGFTGDDCSILDCPGDVNCNGFGSCALATNGSASVVCICDSGHTGVACSEVAVNATEPVSFAYLDACMDDCGSDGTCANAVQSISIPTCFCSDGWGVACENSAPGKVVHVSASFVGFSSDFTEQHQARWRQALGNNFIINPQRVGLLRIRTISSGTSPSFTVDAIVYPNDDSRLSSNGGNPEDPLNRAGDPSSFVEINLAYETVLSENGLECPWKAAPSSCPTADCDCLVSGSVVSAEADEVRLTSSAVPPEEDYKICLPGGVDLCNYKLAGVVLAVICFLSIVYGVRYSYYDQGDHHKSSYENEGGESGDVVNPSAQQRFDTV